jgi:hypothetical protein
MKKSLLIILVISITLPSCLEIKKKEEIFKCVVTSCDEIQSSSIHDEINSPLGYRLKTSCGRSFKSKIKYTAGDTIEVTKVSYD